MKLYHAAQLCDRDSILANGIEPAYSNKLTAGPSLQGRDWLGVYGFTSEVDAKSFAEDNNYHHEGYVIYEFNSGDLVCAPDPEYDAGVSWLVLTDEPITPTEETTISFGIWD